MTKLVTTDMSKLVSWHTDTYQLFSDDTCLVCLTEKQIYLLGNALRQMKWETRWVVADGDVLPDIDAIASELEFKLMDCTDICNEIITCIDTNPSVRDAILKAIDGLSDANGDSSRWLTDAIEPVALCDDDITWGYVKALWDYINQNNKDFLQILAEAGNGAEQISLLFSAVPIFNQLPFDEIALWLGRLGDYSLEAYNASITLTINDQIYCDLFCIAKDNNCSLTFEDIWDYFLDKFGGATFPTLGATFTELITFMILGTYQSDRIVYLWTLIQLGIIFIGAEFVGINSMNSYAVHAQNGDADNDWLLLCTACGWSTSWLSGNGDPVALDGWAVYVSTVNSQPQGIYDAVNDWYDATFSGTSSNQVILEYTFTAQTTITRIKHTGTINKNGVARTQRIERWNDVTQTLEMLASWVDNLNGTKDYTLEFTGNQVFEIGDRIRTSTVVDKNGGGWAKLKTVAVEGEGNNPYA